MIGVRFVSCRFSSQRSLRYFRQRLFVIDHPNSRKQGFWIHHPYVSTLAPGACYCLLLSMIMFRLLTGYMIFQAYLLQFQPSYVNAHIRHSQWYRLR